MQLLLLLGLLALSEIYSLKIVKVKVSIKSFSYENRSVKVFASKMKKFSKSNLPSKICSTCGRPFEWRKKWEKVWDHVKYCSNRCRNTRGKVSDLSTTDDILKSNSGIAHLLLLIAPCLCANVAEASQYIDHPSRQQIQDVQSNIGQISQENQDIILKTSYFRRLDESNDGNFYLAPRFVEHIDQRAVKALISYHDSVLSSFLSANKLSSLRVLDLCSSWVSHVSESIPTSNFIGLGMNEEELSRNTRLTEHTVRDLNMLAKLPYESSSFDIVLLQLSIDYLTHPVEVLQDVYRVLRPGGKVIISFSNRLFIEKAVSIWTGKSDLDHIEIVGSYLQLAGFDATSIEIKDIVPEASTGGDPLYAVAAIK